MRPAIPLEAFRVFEAAARLGTFSAAARELGVTQAAVSRRIAGLEARLGQALFTRAGRRVALTPAGRELALRSRTALDHLAEAVDTLMRPVGPGPVSMVAPGSVSHLWLARRLRAFAAERPDISVRLHTSDAMADLTDEANDLTILYSAGAHARWELTALIAEELVPVASPTLLADKGLAPPLPAEAIAQLPLVDYERFNPHWKRLADWFAHLNCQAREPQRLFSSYLIAVDAALGGEGVALGSRGLVADHLSAGRLVELSETALATGYGYYLGRPTARPLSAEADALHAALAGSVEP